jgi:hypothetical protein
MGFDVCASMGTHTSTTMKRIRKIIFSVAVLQIMIWTVILRTNYAPERIQQLTMLAAAGLTLAAGVSLRRGAANWAQAAQVVALLAYFAVATVWAAFEPEVIEGLLLLTLTGAILLVIVPPIVSVVALHFLKRAIAKNGYTSP